MSPEIPLLAESVNTKEVLNLASFLAVKVFFISLTDSSSLNRSFFKDS